MVARPREFAQIPRVGMTQEVAAPGEPRQRSQCVGARGVGPSKVEALTRKARQVRHYFGVACDVVAKRIDVEDKHVRRCEPCFAQASPCAAFSGGCRRREPALGQSDVGELVALPERAEPTHGDAVVRGRIRQVHPQLLDAPQHASGVDRVDPGVGQRAVDGVSRPGATHAEQSTQNSDGGEAPVTTAERGMRRSR